MPLKPVRPAKRLVDRQVIHCRIQDRLQQIVRLPGEIRIAALLRLPQQHQADRAIDQDARLCPFISLPDLFGDSPPESTDQVEATLALLPEYFLAAFVNRAALIGIVAWIAIEAARRG